MNLKNIINETNFNRDGRVLRSLEKAKKNSGQPYGDTATKKIFNLFSRDDQRMNSDRDRQKVDGAVVRRPKSIFREGVGLKEYYKEILNNLLMTEVTASPKGSFIDPDTDAGKLRTKRLSALVDYSNANQGESQGTIGGNARAERAMDTARAKGMNSKKETNFTGHADRERYAAKSSTGRDIMLRGAPHLNVNTYGSKRTPEQTARLKANAIEAGNRDRAKARSAPGGDD